MSESLELYMDRGWDREGEGCIGYRFDFIGYGLPTLQPQTILSVPCRQVAWFTGVRHHHYRLRSNWIYPSIFLVVKDDHRTFIKVAGPGDRARDPPYERPRRYH